MVGCNEPCSIGSSGSTVFIIRIIALYSGGKRMEYISISEYIFEDEFRLLFLSLEYGRTSIVLVGKYGMMFKVGRNIFCVKAWTI